MKKIVFVLCLLSSVAFCADKVTCYKAKSNGTTSSALKKKCSGKWFATEAEALAVAKQQEAKKQCRKYSSLAKKALKVDAKEIAQQINSDMNSQNCSAAKLKQYKDQLKVHTKAAKNAKKACKKVEKIARQAKKLKESDLEREALNAASSGDCSDARVRELSEKISALKDKEKENKRLAREKKKASKYCSKISNLISSQKLQHPRVEVLKAVQEQNCPKEMYTEANCLAKGKVYTEVNGRKRCINPKKLVKNEGKALGLSAEAINSCKKNLRSIRKAKIYIESDEALKNWVKNSCPVKALM